MANILIRGAAALALLLPLIGCATGGPPDSPVQLMEESAITAAIAGKTLYGRYPGGNRWSEYIAGDGQSAYREGHLTCPGHWEVTGPSACFTYDTGDANCFTLWQAGDKLLFVTEDQDPAKIEDLVVADRIVAGDAEGMMDDREASCP